MSLEIKRFRFGEFVLDNEEKVLLQAGSPVAITPKALQLLTALVENHGRVMEKARLMELVWPDSFVEEGNLTFTVNMLRKVLGDSASDPRFIETVPKRGYRFTADVISEAAQPPPDAADEVPAPPARRFSRTAITGAAAVLLILLVSGVWYATREGNSPTGPILEQPFSVEQLPTSGNSRIAAISPDGKYAVFREESGGNQSVWLRNLETSENVQIIPPSEDDYLGFTFSHAGTSLYFVRKPDQGHVLPALYKVETFGGVPQKLLDNVNRRVTVAPDDARIAFTRCIYRKSEFCALYVANADGTNERKLVATENGVHIHEAEFSPDGGTIGLATGRLSNDSNNAKIAEIDAETGAEREMFPERFYDISGLEWLPNGSGLLFAASEFKDGKAAIRSVSRSTGKITVLTKDAGSYGELSLDRTGKTMIAVQEVPDFRINVISGDSANVLTGARELDASPAGKITYVTFDGEIWSVNRDGSEKRQLTNTPLSESSVLVSPDQRSVYFSLDSGGARHVWRMNADGTDRRQITSTVGGYPLTVSPDGQYVYYRSTLDDLIYRVRAEGGEETLVYNKRLSDPAISPNGELAAYFFLDKTARKIAILDLRSGETIRTLEPAAESSFVDVLAWSADSRSLNYVLAAGRSRSLYRATADPNSAPEKTADLSGEDIIAITPADHGQFTYISGKWNYNVMLIRGLG